jgi:membrane-associated phospholipid phosphatase
LRQRIAHHFVLKTLGITAFITVFFILYFRLLNFPFFPVTVMPLLALDRWIDFSPYALIPYASLWLYVPFAAATLPSKRALYAHGWEAGALALVGLTLFLFWPTVIPPLDLDWAAYPGFAFLKTVDASGNACPSLHVAFAIFGAIRIQDTLREIHARPSLTVINWLWCVAIVYSTLAVKQHVIVDVAAGAILGALGGLVRWTRCFHPRECARACRG